MYRLFLIITILKISKINGGMLFHTWGFWGPWDHHPPGGVVPGPQEPTKWKKIKIL